MNKTLSIAACAALIPFVANANPSMIGKWSCENYSETNQILATVTYQENGKSKGNFDVTVTESGTEVKMYGAYKATWSKEPTRLTETVNWIDIEELTINGESFIGTPTETALEDAMLAEGETISEIIESSEVTFVLQDGEGNISSCNKF
ncbi:hypothetical protein ACFE33_13000 [Falsihalocynthiibacter sp. SS001]|uniref:hypothetical protein n=1 Tax=Falsihalocynthiibacter sp. SS001 TaxID=3349698 RepID=UPI0036D3EB0E